MSFRNLGVAALVGAFIALLMGLSAAPAMAHASLVETAPADGATLDRAPQQATLTFSEPVTVATGGLRVFDRSASRIDVGQVEQAAPETIELELPAELTRGGYVVTWRVLSEDSHPIAGAFTFTVGEGAAVDDSLVAELFSGDNPLVSAVGSVFRAVSYLALLLASGAIFIGALLARGPQDQKLVARLAWMAAVVGVAATVISVPIQALAVTGENLLGALRLEVLADVLTSSFGQGAMVRVVWLVALVLFVVSNAPTIAQIFAGFLAVGSFVLDGHQRSVDPGWLLVLGDTVHLLAGATWFGGLVVLSRLLRRRRSADDPAGAAQLVARFSKIALISVAAVGTAGVAMSWALVRTPQALLSTTYGWTLIAKVALVAAAIAVAFYNRRWLVPAVTGRLDAEARETSMASTAAWRRLRSSLRVEIGVLVGVLAITGALVTIQPAAQAAGVTGAFHAVQDLGEDLTAELVVDPNQVGVNAIHLYVLDATGRPAQEIDDLAIEMTYVPEDIGPFRREPFFAGPGHWTMNVDDLAFAGEWRIRVVAGIDRFTEEQVEFRVFVNR